MTVASTRPSVAIVIPTFNQADFLPLSVESAFAQRYDGQLEVWVVDDASTDHTADALDTLAERHPTLRTIVRDVNSGVAFNASVALAAPDAEFVARLDSDDLLAPTFATELIGLLMAHPGSGYGHSAVHEIDQSGNVRRTRTLARRTGFVPAEAALRGSLSGFRTTANIMMFRKTALEAVNYYRGRPDFVEDYDLAVRLADAGFGNVYTETVLASYRVWDDERGVRARRKGMQLDGYRRIFDEAIAPSWERRGWSAREVKRRRSRLAAHHVAACFAPNYTREETDELLGLLRCVGDGFGVRLRIALCDRGLAPAVARAQSYPSVVKDAVKGLLRRTRGLALPAPR